MRATTLPLILCATLTTTGCSRIADSSLNPLNWFGTPAGQAMTDTGEIRPLLPETANETFDQRGGIAKVTSVGFDRTPDGGILRATGIAATIGQYNAQLVPVSFKNGTLTLAFRVQTTAETASGGANARTITVARVFGTADLAGVRSIVVQGARNARSVRP